METSWQVRAKGEVKRTGLPPTDKHLSTWSIDLPCTSPTIASENESSSMLSQRSLPTNVKAGTTNSDCHRPVIARENSASSDVINTFTRSNSSSIACQPSPPKP